jgi:hypothetical protein
MTETNISREAWAQAQVNFALAKATAWAENKRQKRLAAGTQFYATSEHRSYRILESGAVYRETKVGGPWVRVSGDEALRVKRSWEEKKAWDKKIKALHRPN